MSFIVQILVALIGLGVAIDYALLIVVRWREERQKGADNEAAVTIAMEHAGRAVVFSGTTVAIGLLALVVLPVPFLRSVGYGGMLIPLVSILVALTLLPVILATIGPRLDWPRIRQEDNASRFWTGWATLVVRTEPSPRPARSPFWSRLVALERSGIPAGVLTPMEVLIHSGDPGAVVGRARGSAGCAARSRNRSGLAAPRQLHSDRPADRRRQHPTRPRHPRTRTSRRPPAAWRPACRRQRRGHQGTSSTPSTAASH